jgi:hypothetical protein
LNHSKINCKGRRQYYIVKTTYPLREFLSTIAFWLPCWNGVAWLSVYSTSQTGRDDCTDNRDDCADDHIWTERQLWARRAVSTVRWID